METVSDIMKLKKKDTDMFYRLYWSLLFYVNQKYPVIEGLNEPDLMYEDRKEISELNDTMCNDREIIDSFVSENPFNFNNEELDVIKSWKNYVKDRFLIVAHLKKYTVFMATSEEQRAYGVLGLYDEIEEVVPPLMPLLVDTTLLPYKGKIIYCGLVRSYNIHIGSNMKRSIQAEYQQAKRKFGIIDSLDTPVREKEDADEELLKFYARSRSNRETYWEEIDDLLAEKPELWNVYHREIGKLSAKSFSKRLSEIGVAPAWFAIFEDIIIASGKNEKEVRAQVADLLPEDKMEGVHVYRYGRKARGK